MSMYAISGLVASVPVSFTITMALMVEPETLVNVQSAASAAPPVVALAVSVTGPAMRAEGGMSARYWWTAV